MREIKFRAYNPKIGMSEPITIDFAHGIRLIPSNIDKGRNDLNDSDWVLQQWTGLLDDDGTELYEGDICHDISDSIYEIKFDEGKFVAILDGNVELDLSEVNNDVVKIGNIFENPELIKQISVDNYEKY